MLICMIFQNSPNRILAYCRLQPVKPLNPLEPQSVSGDLAGALDKTKVSLSFLFLKFGPITFLRVVKCLHAQFYSEHCVVPSHRLMILE